MNRAPVSKILPFFVAIFLSLSVYYPTHAEARHKLGSQLRSFKKAKITRKNIQDVSKKGYFKLFMKDKRPFVGVLIKADTDAEETLRDFGAENIRRHGQVYTADIPVDALEDIGARPEILYMRAAQKLEAHLDVSVPDPIGLEVDRPATDVGGYSTYLPTSWGSESGSGVVFGLVDSGIDYTHEDFKTTDVIPTTRIKYIWDQNTSEFCNDVDIDAGTCLHIDDEDQGHGTHVTGIAAGNGQATGNGLPNYRYVGVAPEADIVAVSTTFWTNDIMDGVAYILEKADDAAQPVVVNLSLGGHYGPHDGTHPFDVGLDTMTGPGQIVVTSSGNEGDEFIHNQGVWSESDVDFQFSHGSDFVGSSGEVDITVWHNGLDSYNVTITSPNNQSHTWLPGQNSQEDFGTQPNPRYVTVDNPAPLVTEYNGDKEITISIDQTMAPNGNWDIRFEDAGVNGADPNQIDAWIYRDTLNTQFTNGDNDISVGSPGTAKSVITVGAYITKWIWQSINGGDYWYQHPEELLEDIAPFSSLGPTRDGRLKPDISAPGSAIGSALSGATSPGTGPILPDGVHRMMQGTSMSCPHIAGLSALLLEKHPTYTPAAVKSILAYTARDDAWVTLPPNDTWGYGKAHAVEALAVADNNLPNCASAGQYPTTAVAENTLVAQGSGFTPIDDGTVAPDRYFYQWQKHNGQYFENIAGANYRRLEPQHFSEGDRIRAVVTPYEDVDDPTVDYQDLLLGASQVVEQTIGAGPSFASHTGGEIWNMVCIPTQNNSAVMDDFIIPPFSWNESSQAYEEALTVERGRGYWVYALGGEGYMHSDGLAAPAEDYITPPLTYTASQSYTGRHLIGNPFNKPIYWENTYVSTDPLVFTYQVGDPEAAALVDNMYYSAYDNVEGQYHYYDLDDFEQRDGKIFPWEGFWIIANDDIYLKIPETQPVPDSVRADGDYPLPVYAKAEVVSKSEQDLPDPSPMKGKRRASAKKPKRPKKNDTDTSEESWRMKIGAYSGQLRDDYNYVGIHPDSVDGHDRKDIVDAGTMNAAHLMLYMSHNDWGSDSGRYCVDMHSNAAELHQWGITAKATALQDPVTIFWKKPPSGWELELVDLTSQLRVNMNEDNTYTYSPNGDEERGFVIEARKAK